MFWVNVGLLIGGLGASAVGFLFLLGKVYPIAVTLMVLGGVSLVLVSITGPIARWGAVGLLLTFGVIVTTGGAIAWAVGDIGSEAVEALQKDNDGDGRLNEDPPGDSDRSNSDPTKIDSLAEAQNHADDDGDGLVDEDPPEPEGLRDVTRRVAGIGRIATLVGGSMLAGFGVLAWKHEQARPKPGSERPALPPAPPPQP